MEIGSAKAAPGELDRGYLELTELPTKTIERAPIIVANGPSDGPTLWIHGGIHGNEATGIAVAQDAVDESLVGAIRGAVVIIPNVNPAGLRRNCRTSYYDDHDPNRYFPADDTDPWPPRTQERIDVKLFELIDEHADALIDLHTAGINSLPFIIRNRVPYGEQRLEREARELSAEIDRIAGAFGLPPVTTYPLEEKKAAGLDRSTTSSVMNRCDIPAITAELGTHTVVEEKNRKAGVTGVRNVMRAMDLLEQEPIENEHAPDPPVEFRVARGSEPRADRPGLIRYHVETGDAFRRGDPIGDIVTPTGERKTTIHAERDGYVLGQARGLAVYENDRLASFALREEEDPIRRVDDN